MALVKATGEAMSRVSGALFIGGILINKDKVGDFR
jgi:hypothetical protein